MANDFSRSRSGRNAVSERIRSGLRRGNDARLPATARTPPATVAAADDAPALERPEKVLIESDRRPS